MVESLLDIIKEPEKVASWFDKVKNITDSGNILLILTIVIAFVIALILSYIYIRSKVVLVNAETDLRLREIKEEEKSLEEKAELDKLEREVKRKELIVKSKELDLKEKELNRTPASSIITTNHP